MVEYAAETNPLPHLAKTNSTLLQPSTKFVCMVRARETSFGIFVFVARDISQTPEIHLWLTR